MPSPQSKKQVQSLIGMVNYLSKFSARLSELAELICELLNQITSQLKARNDSLHSIRLVTQADDNLAILKHIIQQGRPKTIKEVPQEIQKYWTFCKELTIEDRLILKGTWIVIPDKMIEDILKQIHKGHLGYTVYWPGLNDQLENLILNCQLCLKYSKSKNKSTQHTALGHDVPAVPWSKVATDIFHYESQPYLLIVDYTSRFPIVRRLKLMSATEYYRTFQIHILRVWMARHTGK